jgi:hypothetical protein
MAIKEKDRDAIANAVIGPKFAAQVEAAQNDLNEKALDFTRSRLGPKILAWFDAAPEGANAFLSYATDVSFKAPGLKGSVTAYAPTGKVFPLTLSESLYGRTFQHNTYPSGTPVAGAVEAFSAVRAKVEEETRSLSAALLGFGSLSRLEKEWPEIWPSVPEHLKAAARPTGRQVVNVELLNERFGLPVERAEAA